MNKGKQFQQSRQRFEHSLHHWNTIDSGLALVAIGLLLTVGETLRVHFNLIARTVTRWCGILFICIAIAVLPAVLKVLLDDAFGTDDYRDVSCALLTNHLASRLLESKRMSSAGFNVRGELI